MPAMVILQRVAVGQTLMVEPSLAKIAATLEPESKQCNRHKLRYINGRLTSEKEI